MSSWFTSPISFVAGRRATGRGASVLGHPLRQDKSTGTIWPYAIDDVGDFEEPSPVPLPSIGRMLNEISGLLGTTAPKAVGHDA